MSQLPTITIPLSAPHLTGRELGSLPELSPLDFLPLIPQFETELCHKSGATFALATPSGTAALELSLRTLNVGPGDLVICPTLTFSATANAILATGATPVFVGSEPTTWGLDPDALETSLKSLTKRPKAIIVVDLYGMPARWVELQTVADQHEIPLVADAAESLGSWLDGRACGTMGVLNAISFNQNKIVTTLGGGTLMTDNSILAAKARQMANQGRQTESPFEQIVAGGNYRMNPIAAHFGICQLAVLAERVAQRRAIFGQYQSALDELPGLCFQPERVGSVSNRWLTAFTIDPVQAGASCSQVAIALRESGIETRPVFALLHRQKVFEKCAFYGSLLADELARTGLCLPSGSGLSEKQIRRVIEVLRACFAKKNGL